MKDNFIKKLYCKSHENNVIQLINMRHKKHKTQKNL